MRDIRGKNIHLVHHRGLCTKWGYKGRGLGKKENGRMETIPLEPKRFRKNEKKETETKTNRKLLYILSDSMLNQMDQA